MKNLLYKELKLATPLLTFLFLTFSLMTFIPGYPILCGAFFVCLGIFQGYQLGREDNDIAHSLLLPVKKTDVVKAKYTSVVFLQMLAFFGCALCTCIRMIFLSEAAVYKHNAMMSANLIFLAFVLLIFMTFNVIFLGGFFKTAYAIGKPFVIFIIINFIIIGIAEILHHLPSLQWLNTLDFSYAAQQIGILLAAFVIYAAATAAACKASQKDFERIDF